MQVSGPRQPVPSPARRALAAAVAVGALLWACSTTQPTQKPPRYQLEGSLVEFMKFGYDEARVEDAPDDFAITFVRFRGDDEDAGVSAGEDVPLKIGVRKAPLSQEAWDTLSFPLAEDAGNNGQAQYGMLSRNVYNDPRRGFTTLQRGMLYLDQSPVALEPGTRVNGRFNVTFDPGIEFSSGRTLFGSFTAVVPTP